MHVAAGLPAKRDEEADRGIFPGRRARLEVPAIRSRIGKPHVGAEIRDSNGGLVRKIDDQQWRTAITPATGTATSGGIPNRMVDANKT